MKRQRVYVVTDVASGQTCRISRTDYRAFAKEHGFAPESNATLVALESEQGLFSCGQIFRFEAQPADIHSVDGKFLPITKINAISTVGMPPIIDTIDCEPMSVDSPSPVYEDEIQDCDVPSIEAQLALVDPKEDAVVMCTTFFIVAGVCAGGLIALISYLLTPYFK